MTRPEHSPAHRTPRGPRGRTDPTSPTGSARRASHRGSTAGRPSPAARPGTRRTPPQPRSTLRPPTPTTVWACGPDPIDPDAPWPAPVLAMILTSLTDPGAQVVLLDGPTPAPTTHHHESTQPPDRDPAASVAAALATVHDLGRTPRLVPLPPPHHPPRHHPDGHPHRTDPAGDHPHPSPATPTAHPATGQATTVADDQSATADLVLASLGPQQATDPVCEHLTRVAARLLRTGGLLTVLTHCDWTRGRLVDPTGPLVAAAQNADLLYLQHIVILHTPIRDGALVITPDPHPGANPAPPAPAPGQTPPAHRRIHADLVLAMQPHDHHPVPHDPMPHDPVPQLPTAAAVEAGLAR
ncbi:MAG: hypothetical protein ACRDSP_06280 [Pseudonocardiaceae bacterium]